MISLPSSLILFTAFISLLLWFDQRFFYASSCSISLKKAWTWSGSWIALALLFNGGVWIWKGPSVALDFLTAYLLEKTLSLDNLFVIFLIFNTFSIPAAYQPRVLSWGLWTAIVLRFVLIITGLELLHYCEGLIIFLGGFLVYSCIAFFLKNNSAQKQGISKIEAFVKKILPLKQDALGPHLFVYDGKKWYITPMMLAMISIEFFDLIFALDSVPAVLALTQDPFIVFSSNIFAILGLRALYFVLADSLQRFYYLPHGVALILGFVGVKMMLGHLLLLSNGLSLAVIMVIMTTSIVFSKKKLQQEKQI